MPLKQFIRQYYLFLLLGLIAGLLILNFGLPLTQPTISTTTPSTGTPNVDPSQNITVTFTQSLSPRLQTKISALLSPATPINLTWSNPTTLIITPSQLLEADTSYQLDLTFKQKMLATITLHTRAKAPLTEEEQRQRQDQLDAEFDRQLKQAYSDIPWLEFLPFEAPNYTVVYDFDQQHLRARIINATDSATIDQLKQEITNKINQIGAQHLPVHWIINQLPDWYSNLSSPSPSPQ